MSASKNINAEKIQGNLNVNGLSATTVNVNGNYSLPNTAGIDGQVLSIDGGAVVWSSVTKTILNVSIGTNDQIPFMNSTPNDFDYSSDLIFDGSKLRVTDGGDYVDIFDGGTGIELYNAAQLSKLFIKPGATNYIYTNTKDLSLYANNTTQMVLENNNPYVGINIAPSANLHIKSKTPSETVFLVENSVGQKLFEVTSDSKVKISDSYTLPNTAANYGNVIVSDGAGGTTWGEFPLEPRWESEGVVSGNYLYRGRVSGYSYKVLEFNYSGNTSYSANTYNNRTWDSGLFVMGGGNNFGTVSSSNVRHNGFLIGSGNTIEREAFYLTTIGNDNGYAHQTYWESLFPTYTFESSTYGYQYSGKNIFNPNFSYSTFSWTSNSIVNMGDNNQIAGILNTAVIGTNNIFYGSYGCIIGSYNSGYTKVDSVNEIHNVSNSFVLGNKNLIGYSNQIIIGYNTSTELTNNVPGIYFGYGTTGGTTNPSAGFVQAPNINASTNERPTNFGMGGIDVFNSGSTTSILHEGAGSGIFYLYRDSSTVEPSANMPMSVALFAKESPRGVVGLAVKDELGTYNLFSDTVSIGFTGGTAMLEVKSKGDTDSTDMLNIKNSNDDVGLRITDGLDVYMPNLPITPGGLSAGGLYVDTATNTIKVV